MSRNVLLTLRFDGSAYHGWQLQENAVTVQQRVNEAVNAVLHEGINVSGCSRTDTGVHARMFCCNFNTRSEIPCEKLIAAVNHYLPRDIAVYDAADVPPDFHARFSCKGKEYVYRILNSKYRDPFYENRAFHYPYALDESLMRGALNDVLGTHDFSAFCASGSAVQDHVRTISSASIARRDGIVEISVAGDGFLYNMVRILVGTLIYMNEGKLPADGMADILASADRLRAGFTAPPEGLYLNRIDY